MGRLVEIEDIEAMRRRVGVDDVELRGAIGRLRVGDRVRLTLAAGPPPAARRTVLVRITGIRGPEFRGMLAADGPAGLRPGTRVTFTAAHIHSLPAVQPARGRRRSLATLPRAARDESPESIAPNRKVGRHGKPNPEST